MGGPFRPKIAGLCSTWNGCGPEAEGYLESIPLLRACLHFEDGLAGLWLKHGEKGAKSYATRAW